MTFSVKLRGAYVWDCPWCHHTSIVEKFFRCVREPDPSGMGVYEVGPRHNGYVFCQQCESRFDVEPPPKIASE